ncbi:wall-associated receptor kinase 4-like [Hordeum vulgare]|uniref:Protein kinase domain-containing protein n=1 Tax=Hordeum vulgare subsp. vulgare TaxID=112509 RepID=A0A8I6XUT4_HORVV|nr:wall-associated receptor kinase 4-like [Hordeum vulgare]
MYYMDPIFIGTGLLTIKSDVYSFGVVLMEFITRKRNEYNENGVLIEEYRKYYEIEKSGRSMFDETIAAEEDMPVLEEISKLAIECLQEDVEGRSDMMEVTRRLVFLRRDRRAGKAQQ